MNDDRVRRTLRRQAGASLAEVLVAIALTGVMLPAFAQALLTSEAARPSDSQRLQALSLEREAMEAVRVAREAGWNNVATDGTYYPTISGNTWALTTTPTNPSGFTRQIVISSIQRNSAGAIVSSGGLVDPSTKRVVITVAWFRPVAASVSTETYLSRWQNETTWTQTTQADFNTGTFNNTAATTNGGGDVEISGSGSGTSWSNPQQVGTYNASGNTNATKVFVDAATNRAYLIISTTVFIIDVATPSSPTLLGSFNSGSALNGVYVSGNYAYLASTNNTAELTVVNVSNPASPTQAAVLNLGDTNDATCIYVSGSYAYVGKIVSATSGINELYIINIATPTAPTLSGSLNLSGTVDAISVSGNYAYLATSITNAELTIVNITNKAAPASAGTYDTAGTTSTPTGIYVGTVYTYVSELNNTGGAELFILDASSPASVSLVGAYEAGADIYGVTVAGSEAFLATAKNSAQFAVLDLTTPSAPTLEGSANLSTNNDIFVANNTAYLASTSNNSELIVMQPGASSGGQAASGTYTSPTFDAGASAGFNYFSFTTTQPTGTSITFQIATNNDNATWNYVGPDGTAFSQYSSPDTIPISKTGNRYFRYTASLNTTSKSVTPAILDVTLTYSP